MSNKADEKDYTSLVKNRKFEVAVLDPKDERRDNIRVTVFGDEAGEVAHHHLRAYEVMRLIAGLQAALAHGPEIPQT